MVAANKFLAQKKTLMLGLSDQLSSGYDIIILDLDMPIMNGYDACRQIRDAD